MKVPTAQQPIINGNKSQTYTSKQDMCVGIFVGMTLGQISLSIKYKYFLSRIEVYLLVREIIPRYAEAKSLRITPLSPSTVISEQVDNLGLSHGVGLSLDSSPLCD